MAETDLDDKGTTPEQGRALLENLCQEGFGGDAEKLSIALGRDIDEINSFVQGDEDMDDDLLMKIRGIAQTRNIKIE